MDFVNLLEYETAAKEKLSASALSQSVYDYYAGGAADEITLKDNRRSYDRIQLKPRVLVDVSRRSLATSVLDQQIALPVLIAPMAFQALAHSDGELATARAANAAGTIMIASTLATTAMEDIAKVFDNDLAKESGRGMWFQLYAYKDRELTRGLVERAVAAGSSALVLTVDAPVQGKRDRDMRNNFQLPAHVQIKNLLGKGGSATFPDGETGSGLAAYINNEFDSSFTWKDIEWLCSLTELPVVIKGVMCAEDALLAKEHGVAAVVVSNHGGRQLDTAPATIDVLTEIVDAADDKMEVYIDGGIRRGTDVLKALAYGAKAVLLGRPVLWGLAVDGERGVKNVLDILRNELDITMGLCGCTSIEGINSSVLASRFMV